MVMSINEEEDTKIVAICDLPGSLQSQCSTRQISWSNDRKRVLILDGRGTIYSFGGSGNFRNIDEDIEVLLHLCTLDFLESGAANKSKERNMY